MSATLKIDRYPDIGPGARVVVVDCRHGTTQIAVVEAPGLSVPDQALVHAVLRRHYVEESCCCTRDLCRRSGLAEP
jgi:hypothetical protein